MNELFQNAIKRVPQNRPPIWFMRQAGRYHQHYQKIRQKHSFMEMCKDPELAAEVALGPILDFDFDVSILFSDLLFPLEALGMGLEYTIDGPRLGFKLNKSTLNKISTFETAIPQLQFQKLALQRTRQRLPKNKSLIGFVGGPWTLFAYAAEGEHSGGLKLAKQNFAIMPEFFNVLIPLLKANIQLQLEGGAEIVMIFDTAAGELSPSHFNEWTSSVLIDLAKSFPNKLGYYSKNTSEAFFNPTFKDAPWAGFGFDHRWDFVNHLKTHNSGFIQGNFDQSLLFLEPVLFKTELLKYLQVFEKLAPSQRLGWVAGLGHGVLPQTPESNVRTYVETLREVFK